MKLALKLLTLFFQAQAEDMNRILAWCPSLSSTTLAAYLFASIREDPTVYDLHDSDIMRRTMKFNSDVSFEFREIY